MKVVHITSTISGGAGIAAYRIHESLMQDKRVDSHIIQKNPVAPKMISQNINQYGQFYPLPYRIKKKFRLLERFSGNEYYVAQINKQPKDYEIVSLPFSHFPLHNSRLLQEADIIHLHWAAGFVDYPSFFKATKQPIVWTLHDMYPFLGIFHYQGDVDRNTNPILKKIDNQMHQLKFECIREREDMHIVTPSKWMQEYSMNSAIFEGLPHSLIPYGFEPNNHEIGNKTYCKEALGLNNGKATLLFIAENIHNYRKGMDLLINALQNIPAESYNIISVGSGDITKLLPANVNYVSFGLIHNPILLNLIYSTADITIVPSREDNLPNVLFESMLNATPVMSFSNGGMAEHITTGTNGILVQEITSEALERAINRFINKEYKFDPNPVRQYPINHLNYRIQAESYFNLYQSILTKI